MTIREAINTEIHMGLSHVIIKSNSKMAIDFIIGRPKEIVNVVQDMKSLAGNLMNDRYFRCIG